MKREILALIPARGGSKGIPRKNLLPLAGKPLIAYSIEQALASRLITRTVVSTDDPEIARVAKAYGAEVPFERPAPLAQDASSDRDVFRHALQALHQADGYGCECVVHLRPTGPIRRVERIDEAIAMFLDHPEADSLRSVTWPAQTPYKMWSVDNGYLRPCLEVPGVAEAHSEPRQSLPEIFWQNGYIDIVRPHVVLELNQIAGRRVLPFVMHEAVFELDYPEDVPRVEAELRRLAQGADDRRPAVARHPT